MIFLLADDDGKLKHELISGLCGDVNFRLGEVVDPWKSKRCTAAFNYLLQIY